MTRTEQIVNNVLLHAHVLDTSEARFVCGVCKLYAHWLEEATRTKRTQLFSYEIMLWGAD